MYIWLWSAVAFIIVVIIALYASSISRLAKVLYLIAITQAYEQVGKPDGPRVLVLGDSTAYGTGVKNARASIAGRIGIDFPTATIINRGVNGWTTADLANSLEKNLATESFDLVLIQIGGNDILQKRPPSDVEADISKVFTSAEKLSQNVVMICCGNVGAAAAFTKKGQPDASYEAHTREVREVFLRVAPKYGVHFVDLFAEPAEDVYLKEPKRYLAFDGLHPNETGYGYWYEKLGPVIRSLLTPAG